MYIASTIEKAVERSISHNETAGYEFDGCEFADLMDSLYLTMDVDFDGQEWDYSTEDDGSLDVYSTDGQNWRIQILMTATA